MPPVSVKRASPSPSKIPSVNQSNNQSNNQRRRPTLVARSSTPSTNRSVNESISHSEFKDFDIEDSDDDIAAPPRVTRIEDPPTNQSIKQSTKQPTPVKSTPSVKQLNNKPVIQSNSINQSNNQSTSQSNSPSADILELQRENLRLHNALQQSESDLTAVSTALLALRDDQSSNRSPSPTHQSNNQPFDQSNDQSELVRDLMRKQKELHNQLNRERAKHAADIQAIKQSVEQSNIESNDQSTNQTINQLNQEIATLTSRLGSAVNQSKELKAKLARATVVLAREIGDEQTAVELLNDQSNNQSNNQSNEPWSGRSEKITALQKQVNEFKRKLAQVQPVSSQPTNQSINQSINQSLHLPCISLVDHERQTNELESINQSLTQQQTVSKCRIRTLETELKQVKTKLIDLIDKSRLDDRLIDRLKSEYQSIRQSLKQSTKQSNEEKQALEQELQSMKQSINQSINQSNTTRDALQIESEAARAQAELFITHQQSINQSNNQTIDELTKEKWKLQQEIESMKQFISQSNNQSNKSGQVRKSVSSVTSKNNPTIKPVLNFDESINQSIKESYATMLHRRDAEIECLMRAREAEKAIEKQAREDMMRRIEDMERKEKTRGMG